MKGRVVVVTGANCGLGYESVKAFALKEAEVILASRSLEKGEEARTAILREVQHANIRVMQLELDDLESVKAFAANFRKDYRKLDVLMNNAGIMMTPYFKTKDGFEGQFGVNHLGHFALTGLLLDILMDTPGARIVNVSSGAHRKGFVDFENLQYEGGKGYTPFKAYRRSKLANLLFTYELQRKLDAAGSGTLAVAAHPGVAMTNLARHLEERWIVRVLMPLFSGMAQDQAAGALSQLRASVDPRVKGGEYYGPGGRSEWKGYPVLVQSNGASHNLKDAARLWEESGKLTGVNYSFAKNQKQDD